MLKLGILGIGEGQSTMSAALASEMWELKTICDLNIDLCKARAKEFQFENYTTDYSAMLEDPEIDAIGIYTPDFLHANHIKQALLHGKHVICTKPLLNDLSEAKALLELQEKTGTSVFVGQSSRFFEPMKRQRLDYEAGLIGDLVTIESNYNADHRWFLGKGWSLEKSFKWLFGGLSHPVDFIRWYLPNIEEVMGYGMLSPNGKKGGLKNPDTMHFIFKADDGRIASVSGTYSSPVQPAVRESGMTCILRGTDGCSQGDYPNLNYAITDNSGEEKLISFENKENYYFRFEGRSHHAGEYQNYLEYFARSINSGRTAFPDLKEGVGTIALLNAMERSLETGQPVKIKNILEEFNL
ncbi:Gfo/Idh/MocA family oxidoreductase [Prolixibacteraceae bacterium Z1-6]|uniref:Gfo/Idh/MocA family oxidoreductase n=1 Tax=Draconibacterium aestuarii TaxID=2998507 RepID=A0A9X3F906_9BACT|nr:Gfo/Idh/MocA family oxidoreductase [Prolixibacteraceae bacterium Z1-6]